MCLAYPGHGVAKVLDSALYRVEPSHTAPDKEREEQQIHTVLTHNCKEWSNEVLSHKCNTSEIGTCTYTHVRNTVIL